MTAAGESTCNIDDVTIECGESSGRKKRSATGSELRILFKLRVAGSSKAQTRCNADCQATSDVMLFDECFEQCERNIEQQRVQMLQEVRGSSCAGAPGSQRACAHARALLQIQGRDTKPRVKPMIFKSPPKVLKIQEKFTNAELGCRKKTAMSANSKLVLHQVAMDTNVHSRFLFRDAG